MTASRIVTTIVIAAQIAARFLAVALLVVAATACQPGTPNPTALPPNAWEIAPMIGGEEETAFNLSPEPGVLAVGAGAPMNGIRVITDIASGLPHVDYRINLEAQRASGDDFFLGLTFPAGRPDTHLSLILGGWGGSVIGLSEIDFYDASQNATMTSRKFQNGRWYSVAVEVREDRISVRLDGLTIIDVATAGRHLSLKPGSIEACAPFGIATWRTEGRFRNVSIERLR